MSWDEKLKDQKEKEEFNKLKHRVYDLECENKHMKSQIESVTSLLEKIIHRMESN